MRRYLAASLFHLARIAQRRGDLDRARESDEAALAILERSDPPDEPALMASAALLPGYLDWRFGGASRSKALIDRAMSIASRRGFRDPEAAIALRILGDIEQRAGNLRRAMELQRRCIEIQARLLPPSHGARGMCWNNVAITSWRSGDAAAARFAAEPARSVWEAAHGPDHPAVATALANLARPVLGSGPSAGSTRTLGRSRARNYPIMAHLAETTHVLRVKNRSGNVHDGKASLPFLRDLWAQVTASTLGDAQVRFRMDGAFFRQDVLAWLRARGVGYAIKVPFYRWLDLQRYIRAEPVWTRVAPDVSGFIVAAAATPWAQPLWVAIYRKRVQHRTAKNFQLDLFDPDDGSYEYSAVTSNLEFTVANLWHFMTAPDR